MAMAIEGVVHAMREVSEKRVRLIDRSTREKVKSSSTAASKEVIETSSAKYCWLAAKQNVIIGFRPPKRPRELLCVDIVQ
jgi:hypothetical protein